MNKIKFNYHIYAMITILFWSLAYVFTRLVLQYVSPYSLGLLRYFVASIAMALIVIIGKMGLPEKKDIKWIVLAGAVGFFLYMITFNTGSQTVSAATSSLVVATTPIVTSLLARIIFKEKLKGLQYGAIMISFLGVVVLTVLEGGLSVNIGLLYQMGSAILLGTYNILQRDLTKRYTSLKSSAYSIFAGTIMLFMFLPQTITEATDIPAKGWFYILALGVLSSAVAYCSWAKALSLAENTSSVSNYMFVTPFVTALLGIWLAGEAVDKSTIIGGIIIIAGLIMFTLVGRGVRVEDSKGASR